MPKQNGHTFPINGFRESTIRLGDRVFVPAYNSVAYPIVGAYEGIVVKCSWYDPKEVQKWSNKKELYRLTIIPDDRHCMECYQDEDEVIPISEHPRLSTEEMLTHWSEKVRQLGMYGTD